MTEVAETLHLQKRGGVWYFFRRVPKPLVPIIGKTFIKRSLGTGKLAEAKRLRTIQELSADALFAAAERGESSTDGEHSSRCVLPLPVLIEHVRLMVDSSDGEADKYLRQHPSANSEIHAERWKDAEYELGILTNPDDPRQAELVDRAGQRVLSSLGAEISDLAAGAEFDEIVRRALIELCRRRIDRLADDFGSAFHDSLFDPARRAAVTVVQLAQTYLTEKEEDYRLNGVGAKRLDKIRASVATVCELVGQATPVSAVDDDVVQRVRSLLTQIPTNRTKLYPELAIETAIERARRDGKPTLSPPTQAHYLDILRDLLKVAVRKKYLSSNPADDARPLKRDGIAASDRRTPWTDQQLCDFFSGSFYRSCAPSALKPYSKRDRDWRFWLPLIMLFSGARPNEICQLAVEDIRQTQAGNWYISIHDENEGSSLKTTASRRRVPIHSELICFGFLRFVEQRRKASDGPRLFPSLKPNKYGNVAWYPVKRLNETYIPAEIVLDERQSLYSLRHNVRDALRRAKAPPETLQAVTGWSPAGTAASDHYGDPGNPDLHAEYVEKIAYPMLDLSFLRPPAEVRQAES